MSKKECPILKMPDHRKFLTAHIKNLPDGFYNVEISRCKDQRTLDQNAYFHGVCVPVIADGLTTAWGRCVGNDEAKATLKDQFLRRSITNQYGEEVGHITRGTAELNKEEFAEFLDLVIEFGRKYLGVEIPAPEVYCVA